MRYFSILLLFIAFEASAHTNKIVAVVNQHPITQYELNSRIKMLKHVNNTGQMNKAESDVFSKMVLNELVDEALISQAAEKYRIDISDEEINEAIKNIEQRSKTKPGQFVAELKEHKVDMLTMKNHIRNELIKNKLITDVLSRSVSVSQSEIDDAVANADSKDLAVSLKVISAENNKDNHKKMLALQDKKLDCDKLDQQQFSFAKIVDLETNYSALAKEAKTIVLGLNPGQHSNVVKISDKLYIYLLCKKELENLTIEENNYISQILGTKKLSIGIKKFLRQLRRKAYIKIMPN